MKPLRVVCLWTGEVPHLAGLAEACLRYTPRVALGAEAVFLEISGCDALYTEEGLKARLKILVRRFSPGGRVVFADSAGLALALARWGVPDEERLPIAALRDFVDPFGLGWGDELERPLETFRSLGLHKLMDFFRLPRRSLAAKFGKLGLFWLQRLEEAPRVVWPQFRIPEKVCEQEVVDPLHEIRDLEPLSFLLKTLLDRLAARLRGLGQRASRMQLKLELEKHSLVAEPNREWRLTMVLPQGGAQGMLSVIRERLGRDLQERPLESAVARVEIVVEETAPAWSSQKDFFDGEQDRREAWDSLVARLAEKLGREQVFFAQLLAGYRPELAWQKTLNEESPAEASEGWSRLPQRPLRILPAPVEVVRRDRILECVAPDLGRSTGRSIGRWEVEEWSGPEILTSQWWSEKFEREYYRVKAHSGEWLWIFRDSKTQSLFLQGFFD